MFPRLMEFYILRWRFDTELKIINSSIWIRLLRNILIFFFTIIFNHNFVFKNLMSNIKIWIK